MIKSNLIDRISIQNPHLRRIEVEKLVNVILEEIIVALAQGDRVEIGDSEFFR